MNKIFSVSLLILIFAIAGVAQPKTNDAMAKQLKTLKADKTFGLNYDVASDATKILGFSEDFGKEQTSKNKLLSFRFGLTFFYPGKTLNAAPSEFPLTFQAQSKKPVFANAHKLIFTIDGTDLDLGEARYASKNGIEYLNFKLTREQLETLAKGKNVSLKIGAAQFNLTADKIKMFADLLALSDPATI